MIDPKLLRTDPDAVRRSQVARGEDPSVVDDVVAADEARREAIAAHANLRCLLYTSPSPRARTRSRMPSSA